MTANDLNEPLKIKMIKAQASELYYEKDNNLWFPSVRKPDFVQDRCRPDGLTVVMIKARTTLEVHLDVLSYAIANTNIRKQWENVLFDFQSLDLK